VPQSGQETRGACPTNPRLASSARTIVRSPILGYEELCMGVILPLPIAPRHVRESRLRGQALSIGPEGDTL